MTAGDRRLLSLIFLSGGMLAGFGDIASYYLLSVHLSGLPIACVMISVLIALHTLTAPTFGPRLPGAARVGLVLILALLGMHYLLLLPWGIVVAAVSTQTAAIVVFSISRPRLLRAAAVVVGIGSSLWAAVASITWGRADIDVFHFQQAAAQAVLAGHNPYSPLVMSPNEVAPGVLKNIPLHFPYGPILPLLEAPVRLLGDVRVLHVVAAAFTAAAMLVLARRAGTFNIAACVAIAFPLSVGMIVSSWVDIVTMSGFAVWLVLYRSHPKVAVVALAIALCVKPTTLIALVPIYFWSVRARRQVAIAAVLAALVVLPFAVATGFSQFYYNVLGVQLSALPRLDSLTINSYLHLYNLPLLPAALSLLVVGVTTVLVLRHRPSTYGQLLTGTAVLVTMSFLVAKWAYFNYYYIAAVLLMLAVAGDALELDAPALIRPPAFCVAALDLVRRQPWGRPRTRRAANPLS